MWGRMDGEPSIATTMKRRASSGYKRIGNSNKSRENHRKIAADRAVKDGHFAEARGHIGHLLPGPVKKVFRCHEFNDEPADGTLSYGTSMIREVVLPWPR